MPLYCTETRKKKKNRKEGLVGEMWAVRIVCSAKRSGGCRGKKRSYLYTVCYQDLFLRFFFSSFLSVSNDHLGLTEQIISEFLSRLHFVLALSHERMDDEVDSGICCAGQWTNLSVSSLQLLLVVKGFTLHDSLPIKQKLKSEN